MRQDHYYRFELQMIRSCKEALADFLISLNPNCTMTAEFGANEDSYEEKRAKAKDEIRETIDPDYIPERRDVTKMTPASLQYAVRLFKEFIHDAENRINGRAFYRLPPEKRIRGVVFPENIHTNIHFHIVANVPERKLFRFCNDAPRYWNQQVKRGSLKASQSLNTSSQKRITKYSSKESYIPENYEHFFFIQDFWGRK